jgi:hypothetical protein
MSDRMHNYDIANKTGRSRTVHENKLIIGSIKLQLDTYLVIVNQGHMSALSISMHQICNTVAKYLHVRRQYVAEIQKQFTVNGGVFVYGERKRGRKPNNTGSSHLIRSNTSLI